MRTPAPTKSMNVSAISQITRKEWNRRGMNPPVEVWPACFSGVLNSDQCVCSAGANPKDRPATTEIANVNQSTVPLIVVGPDREMLTGNIEFSRFIDQ